METNLPLEELARIVRCHVIRMTTASKSGHPGGSLSATDLLVSLYFKHLRHNPEDPDWADRDRVVLSKGHAAPALYAVLAEAGYFCADELVQLRRIDSRLQGHPVKSSGVPGIEASTGSLGQGISVGLGMAMARQLNGEQYHTYVLVGDGEIQEGQIWEAAMYAGARKIPGLTTIIDNNGFQLDGPTDEIMTLEPLEKKWQAFGWATREIDGHSLAEIDDAFEWAKSTTDAPTVIIARTVKGKGVSFMEHNNKFHGSAASEEEATLALRELGEA